MRRGDRIDIGPLRLMVESVRDGKCELIIAYSDTRLGSWPATVPEATLDQLKAEAAKEFCLILTEDEIQRLDLLRLHPHESTTQVAGRLLLDAIWASELTPAQKLKAKEKQ